MQAEGEAIKATLGAVIYLQPNTQNQVQLVGVPICPDLLRYEQIGAADSWRGLVVRAFFWAIRIWPV